MATDKSSGSTAAATPQPPAPSFAADRVAADKPLVDQWDDARPEYLLALIEWIENARLVIDGVNSAALVDPALTKTLSGDWGIPFAEPDWSTEVSTGLIYLMHHMMDTARVQSTAYQGSPA